MIQANTVITGDSLTRQEYDEICNSLDAAAAQHNQQGGQG